MSNSVGQSRSYFRVGWLALAAFGLCSWLALMMLGDTARGFRALLVAFVFFTPIAAALVCWSAIFFVSEAKWVWPWIDCAEAGTRFAVPSLVTLIVLWIFNDQWAPWAKNHFHQGVWLNANFLFGRDLIALGLYWWLARVYVSRRKIGKGQRLSVWVILAYGWVFSLLGFDLVGALDPWWYSSLFGGYFAISALYGAITIWTLTLLTGGGLPRNIMRDFGSLILAFSLLTTAMLYSQLLPIWYADFANEVRFLVPRWNFLPWAAVSLILIFTIYLGPLILLLTKWSRSTRWYLGMVSALLLVLLWVERLWLITPTFTPNALDIGFMEISIIITFVGIFGYFVTVPRSSSPVG